MSLSQTAEAAVWKLGPGQWESKWRESGRAAGPSATLDRARFLRGGAPVAKPGGHQRPLKPCQRSKGEFVRSGGLEKCYVKQLGVSPP